MQALSSVVIAGQLVKNNFPNGVNLWEIFVLWIVVISIFKNQKP